MYFHLKKTMLRLVSRFPLLRTSCVSKEISKIFNPYFTGKHFSHGKFRKLKQQNTTFSTTKLVVPKSPFLECFLLQEFHPKWPLASLDKVPHHLGHCLRLRKGFGGVDHLPE